MLSPPSGGVHVESNDLDITIVTLDRHRIATYVATVLGLDEVAPTFHDLAPLSPVMARFWTDTVTQVRDDVLADSWVSLHPIPVAQAFHTVAAALLSAFPNTVLDHVTDPDAPAPRGDVSTARLREGVDYLDAHADQPIGPDEVAGLVGAPASEVTASLRRRYGTHPAALLWRARLRGVHRDLLDAAPDTARPVEHYAARWGFTRPPQFRVAYRWAFDETPEDTLER